MHTPHDAGRSLPRRALLTGTLAGGVTAGALLSGANRGAPAADSSLFGAHQPGIVTTALPYLSLAGFDVVARTRADLADLLRTWTRIGAQLAAAPPATGGSGPATRLTLTFGFGPSLFRTGRFGIADRRPAALTALPPFPGEAIDPVASDGDLCVQACGSSPAVAHNAVRTLLNAAREHVTLRWRQHGYRDVDSTGDPRDMFGFRDGTANLDVADAAETAEHLWVGDGPLWMRGGTYLVTRRIRLLLDTWDRTDLARQEAVIGRRQASNRRVEAGPTAHTRLASAAANDGAKLLRRSFSYDAGVDPNGLMDAGLIFICFQRDPARQFVAIQRRLAEHDPLNGFSQHLASGLFACPPGVRPGSWIGAELLS